MQPDSNIQASANDPATGTVPPLLPASPPPVIGVPPRLPRPPARRPELVRPVVGILLSICLGLFLADGIVSLADESLILLLDVHLFTVVRGIVFLLALLTGLVIYGLMGLTPMIPKRLFLPVTLFNPAAALFLIPLAIYFPGRLERLAWIISFCQVALGLGILCRVQGGFTLRWPLVADNRLGSRGFGWLNLSGFLLVNVFVLLPAVLVYLAVCAVLAVDHFSEGFLALRPGGIRVRVRQYVRQDGKTIRLVPMAHVGEAAFYRQVSQSFPTNAVVLMEGVTDTRNLLTNKITYRRMAASLGLAEQQKEFKPARVELVMADVDVEHFTTTTIGCLNLAMLIHAQGLTAENVLTMLRFSPPPHFEEQLLDDLVRKRNRHVLEEIHARLRQPGPIIVPWGVAHMPGIAEGIEAAGFRLNETQEYTVIRFRSPANATNGTSKPK